MGWFKRLCLFVFGLAGLLALCALSLPWVGPYTAEAQALLMNDTYFTAVVVVVGISGFGLIFCILRALFAPRNRKSVTITSLDGGKITVTRTAIASQARHIVEQDGTCMATATHVRAKKRGHIRVNMRVTPLHALNVVEKGQELHDELMEGLATICNDKLDAVNLEFVDARDYDEPEASEYEKTYLRVGDEYEEAPLAPAAPTEAEESAADADTTGDIRVPMRHALESAQVESEAAEPEPAETVQAEELGEKDASAEGAPDAGASAAAADTDEPADELAAEESTQDLAEEA
ncbi:MAG: alkaline shock response membrane anchor protein AmaP [Atopobiaceae bacterium]|jgi:hypothetical protein